MANVDFINFFKFISLFIFQILHLPIESLCNFQPVRSLLLQARFQLRGPNLDQNLDLDRNLDNLRNQNYGRNHVYCIPNIEVRGIFSPTWNYY